MFNIFEEKISKFVDGFRLYLPFNKIMEYFLHKIHFSKLNVQ